MSKNGSDFNIQEQLNSYSMKFFIWAFLPQDRTAKDQIVSFCKLDGIIYIPYSISYSLFPCQATGMGFFVSYQVEIEVVTLRIKASFHPSFHVFHHSQKNGNI